MTEAELLETIRAMAATDEDGFTTLELAKRIGCSESRAYSAVVTLVDAGKLRAVMVRRTSRHGKPITICGYAPSGGGHADAAAKA